MTSFRAIISLLVVLLPIQSFLLCGIKSDRIQEYSRKTTLTKFDDRDIRISFAVIETTVKFHQSIIFRNGASDLFLSKNHIKDVNFAEFSKKLQTFLYGWLE